MTTTPYLYEILSLTGESLGTLEAIASTPQAGAAILAKSRPGYEIRYLRPSTPPAPRPAYREEADFAPGGDTCRKCGGPCADGSGDCGEC